MGVRFTPLMLSQAGFSDSQIIDWVNNQRKYLKIAGFSDMDINDAYGITMKESESVTADDLASSVSDVFLQHNELGKEDALKKKSIKQNEHSIDVVSVNENHTKNIDGTNYNALQASEKDQIKEIYENASKLYANDESGKVGYINKWFEENKPNVNIESTKFLLDSDLSVVESLLNEDQKALLKGIEARDILEGKVGFDSTDGTYTVPPKEFEEAETKRLLKLEEKKLIKEQEKNAEIKVLNTPATTREATMPLLLHAKNHFNVNDWELMRFNEALSFIASLESDNRNILNAQGSSAAGYFQLTKDTMDTALKRYLNIMNRNDKNYQVPPWVVEAFEHMDMMKLTDDQQRALAMANLLERKGTDDLIRRIMVDNDKEALKELYKIHHVTGDISDSLLARIDKYVDTWGTDKYIYQMGQLPYLPSDNIVTKAIEKIPVYGDNIVTALGGKGTYSVFTNGYNLSVNGFIDNFHQLLESTADQKGELTPEDIQELYMKTFMHQEQTFGREIVQSVVTLANDMPWMIGGCFAANAGAAAMTGGASAVAAPVVCGAGAFALPEIIRDSYMRAIQSGEVGDFTQFLKHFFDTKTAITGTKASIIGGATLGVGNKVSKVVGPRLGTSNVAMGTTTAARLGSEITTMVTLGSLLEGQIPTKHDFAHATVLIFGLHGSIKTVGTLKNIYRKYSIHPREMVTLAQKDIAVMESLRKGEIPQTILNASEVIVKGMEKTANIKLLPVPKYKLNEKIHITAHGGDTAIVVGKEAVGNTEILVVKKPNNEIVKIPSTEARCSRKRN